MTPTPPPIQIEEQKRRLVLLQRVITRESVVSWLLLSAGLFILGIWIVEQGILTGILSAAFFALGINSRSRLVLLREEERMKKRDIARAEGLRQ